VAPPEQPHGSAADQIGPHLLGRKPNPPDKRDFRLEDYMDARRNIQRQAAADGPAFTAQMTMQELAGSDLLDRWHDIYAFWHWFDATFLHPKPAPTPVPTPTPAPEPVPAGRFWKNPSGISNQGQTPHCVGFTGLDYGNADPVNDGWPNSKGHDLYYLCEPQDKGVPIAQQGGSTSRALCKVLAGLGRIGAYAFTQSAATVRDYVLSTGPVGTGVQWDLPMFNPDLNHYIWPDASQNEGGHELTVVGYEPKGYHGTGVPSVALENHWTDTWADKGICYMTMTEYDKLLKRDGDAWAALENPLQAAVRKAVAA
jgi:hypothetical protein